MNKNKWVGAYLIAGGSLLGLVSVIGLLATVTDELPEDVTRAGALTSSLFGLLIASANLYAGSIVWDA
jgi:hypothetical protein